MGVLEIPVGPGDIRRVGCGGPAPGAFTDAFPGAALHTRWRSLTDYGGSVPMEGPLTVTGGKAKAAGASGNDYGNVIYGGGPDCSRTISVDVATEGATPNQDHSVLFMAADDHGYAGMPYRQCYLYLRHSDGRWRFFNDTTQSGTGTVTPLVGHRLEIEYNASNNWFIARIDGVQKSVFVGDFYPLYFPGSVYDGMYAHVDTAAPTFDNFELDAPCLPPGRLRMRLPDGVTWVREACDDEIGDRHPLKIEDPSSPGDWINAACMVFAGRYVEPPDPRWFHNDFSDVIYEEQPTTVWRTREDRSVRILTDLDGVALGRLSLEFVVGHTYRLSVWIRQVSGDGSLSTRASVLEVQDMDAPGTPQYMLQGSTFFDDTGWTLMTGTFTAINVHNDLLLFANAGFGYAGSSWSFYASDWFIEDITP